MLPDQAIEMHVKQVEAGRGAPVTEQARLDVLALQRLFQQRVVAQVDLADGKIIGGAPVGVQSLQLLLRECV